MTAPDTMVELAERCEKATGPDGGLNLDIAGALGLLRENAMGQTVFTGTRRSGSFSVPRYTASLDAAMTLVPELGDKGPPYPKMWREAPEYWRAHIGYRNKAHGQNGKAATPALALCAAALKARAQAKDSK